jgi:ribonuclease HI
VFTSDSKYIVEGMNEWLPAWKARDWKKKGGPILNLELWKQADEIVSSHETHWRWVRGHNGQPQNEYANFLATRAAAEQSNSGGLRESEFGSWLANQKEAAMRETAPFPDLQSFQPRRRSWTT